MRTIDSEQHAITYSQHKEDVAEDKNPLVRSCLRFWKQGKMLDWAVLFFITAMLAAFIGLLVGSPDGIFNYAGLLSLASLVMGVAGLFLDTRNRG